MDLRPYQRDAIDRLRDSARKGSKRIILQLATGSGKTVIGCKIVQQAEEKGKKVLWLAPRRELIYQAVDSMSKFGIYSGTIMAGEKLNWFRDVQVASFDTLHSRVIRNKTMDLPPADLVIADEAHLSIAKSRLDILNLYPNAVIIGLTATPARSDGKGLGAFYDDLIEGASIPFLIEKGYLSPAKYYAAESPNLEGVKINRDGDYQEKQLGEVMDNQILIGEIVHNWLRLAKDTQTVVFCVNRKHARHVNEQFLAAGIKSEYLDGETPKNERADILKRVGDGSTTVLCNVFVATYGLDIPCLETVVMARPTRSVSLYLQMVGRALRTHESKDHAKVIDHAGVVDENGFADEEQYWSLDTKTSAKERKEQKKKENKEPKEITCAACGTVFAGRRNCPSCGATLIPPSEPIPHYEVDLVELDKKTKKKKMSWDERIAFIGGLKTHAYLHGYGDGWVAHTYRDKTGVWPNDKRVRYANRCEINEETANFIKHKQIRYYKGRNKG